MNTVWHVFDSIIPEHWEDGTAAYANYRGTVAFATGHDLALMLYDIYGREIATVADWSDRDFVFVLGFAPYEQEFSDSGLISTKNLTIQASYRNDGDDTNVIHYTLLADHFPPLETEKEPT